jgi:hypothetical protein
VNVVLKSDSGFYIASVKQNGTGYSVAGKMVDANGSVVFIGQSFEFADKNDAIDRLNGLVKIKIKKNGWAKVETGTLPKAIEKHLELPPENRISPAELAEILRVTPAVWVKQQEVLRDKRLAAEAEAARQQKLARDRQIALEAERARVKVERERQQKLILDRQIAFEIRQRAVQAEAEKLVAEYNVLIRECFQDVEEFSVGNTILGEAGVRVGMEILRRNINLDNVVRVVMGKAA